MRNDLELASQSAFRERQVRRVTIDHAKEVSELDEKSYLQGFLDGANYCDENPILKVESPSDRAWELSKEYLTDSSGKHQYPLCHYFEKAITEQKIKDKEVLIKVFDHWAKKTIQSCVAICNTYSNKAPEDKVEVNVEELIIEIKGIEAELI